MNKAIIGTGAAGGAAAAGMAALNLALGAVVFGAAAVVAVIGAVTIGLVALGSAGVSTAASVESAFAGVLKVTTNLGRNLFDLTEVGEQVFQDFRDLAKEIPLTFEELAKIGAFGGQLGVAEEQLADFTRTIASLAVATNLSLEEASLGLTRIGNIFGVTTDEMAANTERLGSAIVFLGNNFNVLEADILLASRNIAGAAALVGLSQADILGIGSAMIGVGVRAEAGGTAVSRALIDMNTAVIESGETLEMFAKTAGLTVEEFTELWEVDATEAFLKFVDGLAEAGDEAAIVLDEVGLGAVRSLRTFLGLAAASDELREKVDASNKAFEENTALAREAEIRFATFDSQVQILKNSIRDMGITIGLELIPRLLEIVETAKPVIDAIAKGIGPAVETIADAIEDKLIPAIGNLLTAFGIELPGEGLLTPADQITAAVQGLGETIATHIENISFFIDEIARLIDLFKEEGIGAVIDDITGEVSGFAGELETTGTTFGDIAEAFEVDSEKISSALENIRIVGEGAAIILGSAFENIVLPVLEIVVGLVGNIIDLLASLIGAEPFEFGEILESLGKIGETLIEGLPEIIKGLGEAGIDIISGLFDIEPAVMEERIGRFFNAIELFFTEAIDNLANVVGPLVFGILETINLFFTEAIPQAIEDSRGWLAEFVNGIIDAMSESFTTFIDEEVPKIIKAFVKVGKEIIAGILRGLQANAQKVITFLVALAHRAINAVISAVGGKSPSTVFEGIGEDIMAGLTLGIENLELAPQVALAHATDRTINAATQTIPSSISNVSSTDRSFNVGDLNMITQPESPASIGLILQQIALLQAGA